MLERIKEVSEAARLIPHGAGRYSQLGEDVILKYIAQEIGVDGYLFIDIGASDGQSMSNSFLFRSIPNWSVLAYDGGYENEFVKQKRITPGNLKEGLWPDVAKAMGFEDKPDPRGNTPQIVSIDIDGQDYWVLKEFVYQCGPSIICLEFNGCIQQDKPVTVPLDDNFKHDGSDYYGANLPAFKKLLSDYTLVFHHHSQNAFFVHKSFGCPEFTEPVQRVQYHPHSEGREWITL